MAIRSEDDWRKVLPPEAARKASGNWVVGDLIGTGKIVQILGGPGKSGMGTVYICDDIVEGQLVAVKTIQRRFLKNGTVIDRFKWEAETWVRLAGC